jgi:hypothetical protein
MTKNQKILAGCGGAGCLGIILLGIIGGGFYFYMGRRTPSYNYNFNTNANRATNRNSNLSSNSNSNTSTSSNTSSSSMSEDDKHKLFQAASMTGDAELVRRVNIKIGLTNEDYSLADNYQEFVAGHFTWALKNADFIQEMGNKEKARAYVNEHFDD